MRRTLALGLSALSMAALALRADDWGQFRRDAQRRAASPETIPAPLTVLWTQPLSDGEPFANLSSPAVADGQVFVGAGRYLYALDAKTGTVNWRYAFALPVSSSPACYRGTVICGSRDGTYVRLSTMTGKPLAGTHLGGSPAVSSVAVTDSGLAVVGVAYPVHEVRAYRLHPRPEKLLWRFQTRGPVYGSPAVSGGKVVVSAADQTLYCLNESDGSLVWEYGFSNVDMGLSTCAIHEQAVYLTIGGNVHALSLDTGALLWSRAPNGVASGVHGMGVAIQDTRLFASRLTTGVVASALNQMLLPGGNDIWQWSANSGVIKPGVVSSPSIAGTKVWVGADRNLLMHDFASSTPEGIHPQGEAILSSPTPANGIVYSLSLDGVLYAYQSGNHSPDAPASGFVPEENATITSAPVTLSWDAPYDPEHSPASLRYEVRLDDDGEVRGDDADFTATTDYGQTSVTVPGTSLTPRSRCFWAVRAQDANGAYSSWSVVRRFAYQPSVAHTSLTHPRRFKAIPFDQTILLTWEPPRTEARPATYALSMVEPGRDSLAFDVPFAVLPGDQTSFKVGGLTNGVRYFFALTASFDALPESPAVFASEIPNPQFLVQGENGKTHRYPTLAAAVAHAHRGDTVIAPAGTFDVENLTLADGVSLRGASPSQTLLVAANPNAAAIRTDGKHRRLDYKKHEEELPMISNLSVVGGSVGILIEEKTEILVQNVVLVGSRIGISAEGSGSRVVVKNVTASDIVSTCLSLGGGTRATLRNNVFHHAPVGVAVLGAVEKGLEFATTYSVFQRVDLTHTGGAKSGAGDVALGASDPLFRDAYLHEDPASAAVDGGNPYDNNHLEPAPNGNRINAGAYGNTPEAATSPEGASSQAKGDERTASGPAATGGCFISGR